MASQVEIFTDDSAYDNKVHLCIRTPRETLVGIGTVDLTGLRYGAFAPIDGFVDGDYEQLVLDVARAAAAVIEQRIDLVRDLQARSAELRSDARR